LPSTPHSKAIQVAQAHRAKDPERIAQARRELAEANIQEAIERALSAAPPLTSAQVTRLSGLLRKHQPDMSPAMPRERKAGRK
jgi:hypothetical protein